ncbi:beta-glucosidase family protein [Amycolatopsis solani]|uniref:beta-glucosidase family protein n=1 Tax=Amycolatopsis solani TaxID=3028615 RepID=UPI0025B1524D|nr:glycoside hydrolase family 3 C-terminal domain-containing protein [Amycolatopsis sp. MEP2-6]
MRNDLLRARPRLRTAAVVLAGVLLTSGLAAAGAAADPAAKFSPRVRGLVGELTLDEKLSLVHGGTDPNSVGEAGYVPGVPRLGVPSLRLADGSAGVRVDKPSVVMPAPVALASSFDESLATRYGAGVGREARALGTDVLLSPMVNTIRIPYGGRNFETFSEDPLLTSRIAAAEVKGIAGQGTIPVVKHLAGNNQENDRQTINVQMDDQTLHEVELPGFEAAVKAGAGAVMCSYNNLNGPSACANGDLLTGILREQLAFKGWVMSDWRMSLTPDSLPKGLDQEMPDGTYFGDQLKTAISEGKIPQSALDTAVARILGQMDRFHLLDNPARPARDLSGLTATAQDVAQAGAVLLRNEKAALPLSTTRSGSVAVIGYNAKTPKLNGGGSSHVLPSATPATPLDQIKKRAGSTTTYTAGYDPAGEAVPADALSPAYTQGGGLPAGSEGVFYNGTITAPTEGDYSIQLQATGGGGFLQVDGTASGLFGDSIATGYTGITVHLTAGQHSLLLYGFADFVNPLKVNLHWLTPVTAQAKIAEAVAAAKAATTPIVFAYDDSSEGLDRPDLSLPGYQDELIDAVATANPRTVVVLNTASAVKMPWLAKTAAVLEMWYPGQKGAEATTALLYGDVNPQGKLTQTFPVDEAHTLVSGEAGLYPGQDGQVKYTEGVDIGYRWYADKKVTPLFPFGYGLSYTSFAYSGLTASNASDGGLDVKVTVRNTGTRTGTEVAQVFVGPSPQVTAPQAPTALGGYAKVTLTAGAYRTLTIHVDPRQLSYWDSAAKAWKRGGGTRSVKAGSSSASLPLSTTVTVN